MTGGPYRWTSQNSFMPPYRRIAIELRHEIRDLPSGARAPSSRDIEARFGVANMTARAALGVLRAEGMIELHQGRGYFVVGPGTPGAGEPGGGRAPYRRLAELVRREIAELNPGDKLPSARTLQERHSVASGTVQNALRLLRSEGLLYSVPG
ncbi:GntR family transcriptional regulator [Streptomyces sp. NPDC051776]|uniref:GntR family transcriptional regulator n=1 Tax=Streptomyces sp. NPDC051776 TaxID=3155414 RepID=UPI003425C912